MWTATFLCHVQIDMQYNQVAQEVMQRHDITVNDLYQVPIRVRQVCG